MSEKIVGDYLEYIKNEKKLTENTLEAYIRDIMQFKEYLQENKITSFKETTKTTVITYLMSLQKKGKSTSTISRNLASIRCFFQFLLSKRIIDEDPTMNLKSPKCEKKIPSILTIDEVNLLLSQPNPKDFKGARDKAMLELLYATGLRVSEIISLNMDDVQLDASLLIVRENENYRVIPIGREALKALKYYITNYRANICNDKEPLFLNYSGKRLTRQGFWKIIKQYTKRANINKDITPQTLRHSFAVHLIENGADIRTVKEILGHSDISTTQIYSYMANNKELREVYNNSHPRA
ncbi:MAG TPA: site-specific tyrosine recombinase XerD [Tissierellaceae bacterium]